MFKLLGALRGRNKMRLSRACFGARSFQWRVSIENGATNLGPARQTAGRERTASVSSRGIAPARRARLPRSGARAERHVGRTRVAAANWKAAWPVGSNWTHTHSQPELATAPNAATRVC